MNSPQTPPLSADTAEDAVMIMLMQVGRRLRERSPGDLVDPAAMPILFNLRAVEQSRLSDLAARMRLDASTVSRHVRQLEDKGLLVRTDDPDDRRASQVALTPEGATHLDQIFERKRALVAEALADWDDSDRETLRVVLERLARDMSATTPDLQKASR